MIVPYTEEDALAWAKVSIKFEQIVRVAPHGSRAASLHLTSLLSDRVDYHSMLDLTQLNSDAEVWREARCG